MNKFMSYLIFQNIILLYLILFIPVSLLFKAPSDYSLTTYFFLFLFFVCVIVIFYLNNLLINDKSISFGFLHFYPFIFLLRKFNRVLKRDYPNYQLSDNQKQIIIIFLMNKHSYLTEKGYYSFSDLMKIVFNEQEPEFMLMIETTPFWIELHEYADHYALNRQLLTEKGLKFNDKRFSISILIFFVVYIIIIIIIYSYAILI